MPRQTTHVPTAVHSGPRDDIDLLVVADDGTSSHIEVQCNVKGCCKRFSIVRNSLRKERYKARKVHSGESAMALVSSSNEASEPSVVVSSHGEGQKYLKHCGVDKVILSVHRQLCDGVWMLYAKTVDQKLHILGREVHQAMGYPSVMYQTGSTVELDQALQQCQRQFHRGKVRDALRARHLLEQDHEWRERIAAFNLLCDPRTCPRVEDCTAENLDRCVDMLTDAIPGDSEQPIWEDGVLVGFRPRLGTHIPRNYINGAPDGPECILDHHPPGDTNSPARLLPVLVDIVAKDRRSHRKECVFQLRSGELVKSWMTVDDGTHIKRIFPHLDRLSQRPVLAVALYDEEPIPPPVRVSARIEQTRMPLLEQDGCSALERLEPTPPCDEKRRAELTRDILHGKAEECLELLRVVKREEATPEQMAAIAQRKVADDVQNQGEGLHTLTKKLMARVKGLACAQPRRLPRLDSASVQEMEAYIPCDALHRSIVLLAARQGSVCAASLDAMSLEQLEAHWAKVTQ